MIRRPQSSLPLAILLLALSQGLTACSSGGKTTADAGQDTGLNGDFGATGPCSLAITKINGKSITGDNITKFGPEDDQDVNTAGIQVDVEVQATNLVDGTEVTLSVSQLRDSPKAQVNAGIATFDNVTVDPTLVSVTLSTGLEGCSGDQRNFAVEPTPECFFQTPQDGEVLGVGDDKTQGDAEFIYDIRVAVLNADSGTFTLSIDGSTGDTQTIPQGSGSSTTLTFLNQQLPVASNFVVLGEITVGNLQRSCRATISVNTDLPSCRFTFNKPAVKALNGLDALGINQDENLGLANLQAKINVETDSNVDVLELFVDDPDTTAATAPNAGGFSEVTIADSPDDTTQRDVWVICKDTDSGATSRSPTRSVLVDSIAPDSPSDFVCTATNPRAGTVTCTWSPVGTPPGSGVTQYEVRYRTDGQAIDNASWDSATLAEVVSGDPPGGVGVKHTVTIQSLPIGSQVTFGVRSIDQVNQSDVATGGPVDLTLRQQEIGAPAGAETWGAAVASGDFDCDGLSDLAVGSPEHAAGAGRVRIYIATTNGFVTASPRIINGTVAGDAFGYALASIPNFFDNTVGGRVCHALAVHEHRSGSNGRVYIFQGGAAPFSGGTSTVTTAAAKLVVEATAAGEHLGPALTDAGDFNNDGRNDLAVQYTNVGAAGTADDANTMIINGRTLPATPATLTVPGDEGTRITGGLISEAFSTSLCGGFSLDGDAFADIVIGARGTDVSGTTRGAIYVVSGAAAGGTVATSNAARVSRIVGGANNSAFGEQVSIIGDMDKVAGDLPEFAAVDTTVSAASGAVYVFNLQGGTPASADDALMTITNDVDGAASDKLGTAIGCGSPLQNGGDLNGDDFADIVVSSSAFGANGSPRVFFFAGKNTLADTAVSGADVVITPPTGWIPAAPNDASEFGRSLQWAADINGDGENDLIIGDPRRDTNDNSADGRGRVLVVGAGTN